jgi:osmotically-inducible protein OsmY
VQNTFSSLLREEGLFCKDCSSVSTHRLYSRTPLDLSQPVEGSTRLLAVCRRCGTQHILFAMDLRCLVPEKEHEFGCKILGRSRVVVNDWVLVPELGRPALVVKRFRVWNDEKFVLQAEDGTTLEVKAQPSQDDGDASNRTYKLLPYQIGSTLVGDWVYHLGRASAGKAVGMIHGVTERLIIQLEDSSYLLLTLPHAAGRVRDNRTLDEAIRSALVSLEGFDTRDLDVQVSHGIVYLKGGVRDLMDRESLIKFVESLEGVLAVMPQLEVKPRILISDAVLQEKIQLLLAHEAQGGLIGVRISVQEGVADLSGFVENDSHHQRLHDLLATLEGLKDFRLHLRQRTAIHYTDQLRSQEVLTALRRNSALDTDRIAVHSIDGIIYLEGTVSSTVQRSTAYFTAMWSGRNLNVVNNLQVDKGAVRSYPQLFRRGGS